MNHINMEKRLLELESKVETTISQQPTIEAISDYIEYQTGSFNNPLKFEDREGFKTRYATECEHIAKMVLFFKIIL